MKEDRNKICVSVARKEVDDALRVASEVSSLADVIEIRLDYLSDIQVEPFINLLDKPVLFTNRPLWEGGKFSGDEDKRIVPLLRAVELGADYIDLEMMSPDLSNDRIVKAVAASSTKLILSWHNFKETPSREELIGRLAIMQDKGAHIGKLITTARNYRDSLAVLALQEDAEKMKFPLVAFCMGKPGVITRVASTELGGYMTYCAVNEQEATAPGQLSVGDMREIYKAMSD